MTTFITFQMMIHLKPTNQIPVDVVSEYNKQSNEVTFDPYDYRYMIYITFGLTSLMDRCWEFTSIVYLTVLFPTTLLYSSLFGLFESLCSIMFATSISHTVDSHNKLNMLRYCIIAMDMSIAFGCCLLWYGIVYNTTTHILYVYICILIMGGAARIASAGIKLLLNKYYIVAMCQQSNKNNNNNNNDVGNTNNNSDISTTRLSSTNSVCRAIDLSASILAPMCVGLLDTFITPTYTIALLGCVTAISTILEVTLSGYVYNFIPALHTQNHTHIHTRHNSIQQQDRHVDRATVTALPSITQHDDISFQQDSHMHIQYHTQHYPNSIKSIASIIHTYMHSIKYSLHTYISHIMCVPSIAYCMTYLSVINFGAQLTAYLNLQHFDMTLLSLARGLGAIVGVVGSLCNPYIVKYYNVHKTALVSVVSQLVCITPVILSFYIHIQSTTVHNIILIVCIALSRFGLWNFDISINTLLQTHVQSHHIADVNSIQDILCNIMYIASFSIGIVYNQPDQFYISVTVSYVAVLTAATLYTVWYRRVKHNYTVLQQNNNNKNVSDNIEMSV